MRCRLTLVPYELATNAAKHGALRAPEGRISVHWSVEDNATEPYLVFQWKEHGGCQPRHPKKGFGSVLLEHALSTPDRPPTSSTRRRFT
jgi:two-component sensor histidine kinase